jgi:branched-chain amino acid transport system substrate-binding protein
MSIVIGAVFPMTGAIASYGVDHKAAGQIAIDEVNQYMQAMGRPERFQLVIDDGVSTPADGLKATQSLVETKGAKVIIGPLLSGQLNAILSYVNSHKIVTFGLGTSPTLHIPRNMTQEPCCVFRLQGSDDIQAKALANVMWSQGIRNAVVPFRDDTWGVSMSSLFQTQWQAKGGQVTLIKFEPNLPDYGSEVAEMNSAVQAFGVGPTTGLIFLAFEQEGLNMLGHAGTYPALQSIRWFGHDSVRVDTYLPPKSPPDIAGFLYHSKLMGTFQLSLTNSPAADHYLSLYRSLTGHAPELNGAFTYDSIWVAALAILAAGKYDGEAIAAAVPQVAARYQGATGYKLLDSAGDVVLQDFSVWALFNNNGIYAYQDIGIYDATSGVVTINHPLPAWSNATTTG